MAKKKPKAPAKGKGVTTVTIKGHHFRMGAGATVDFDGQSRPATVNSTTELTFDAPSSTTAHTVTSITVHFADGSSANCPFNFSYFLPDPDVNDMNPQGAPVDDNKSPPKRKKRR